MKKFYFLFLFALIASIGNLYAAEKTVTFDFSTDPGAVSGIKNGEITVSFDKSAGTTPPKWYAKKWRRDACICKKHYNGVFCKKNQKN